MHHCLNGRTGAASFSSNRDSSTAFHTWDVGGCIFFFTGDHRFDCELSDALPARIAANAAFTGKALSACLQGACWVAPFHARDSCHISQAAIHMLLCVDCHACQMRVNMLACQTCYMQELFLNPCAILFALFSHHRVVAVRICLMHILVST